MADTKKKLGSLKPKNHGVKAEKAEPKEDMEHYDEPENVDVDDVVDIDGELDHEDVEDVDDEHDNDHHDDDNEDDVATGPVLLGRVKWFNDRRGYGYITCISPGEYFEQDIFVHHTNIRPQEKSYRTLHVNEYVQFRLGDADLCYDDEHNLVPTEYEHQATVVRGVNGGPLLCDGPFRPNNRRGQGFRGGSNRNRSGPSSRYDDDNDDEQSRYEPRQNQRQRTNNSNNNRVRRRNDDDENWQSAGNPRGRTLRRS